MCHLITQISNGLTIRKKEVIVYFLTIGLKVALVHQNYIEMAPSSEPCPISKMAMS